MIKTIVESNSWLLSTPPAASSPLVTLYSSTCGVFFRINPAFEPAITSLIAQLRQLIASHKANGKFLAYLSVPISSKGGSHFDTNNAIASATAKAITSRFGQRMWVLNPADYNLPSVGAIKPGGGEYMAVWADVLGGIDGKGNDFDLVYFIGPADVWSFFGLGEFDKIGDLEKWIDSEMIRVPDFAAYISQPGNRESFVRYFALRGSATYSKGAHDEWNIVARLNQRRAIGDDIAVFYNGFPIEPGDFDDQTDVGYQETLSI